MQQSTPYYINKLRFEYESLKEVNDQYSLRSFARKLDVDPGTLSRIIKGQRIPSLQLGKQIVARLNLSSEESHLFLNSLSDEKWNQKPLRVSQDLKNFRRANLDQSKKVDVFQIELEQYRVLADWIHYAILELTFVDDFQHDPQWIAHRLGRQEEEVRDAIQRLISLGLLKKERGQLIKTKERITTADKSKTTKPLKKLQKDLLNLAIQGIDQVDYDKRASVSITMAINPDKIIEARQAFVDFSERICDLLEEGTQSDVYNLIINLSPVCFKPIKDHGVQHDNLN